MKARFTWVIRNFKPKHIFIFTDDLGRFGRHALHTNDRKHNDRCASASGKLPQTEHPPQQTGEPPQTQGLLPEEATCWYLIVRFVDCYQ